MELQRDLLQPKKKSLWRIVLGLLFFIIAVILIIDRQAEGKLPEFFDWFLFAVLLLNGIVHSMEGFGFPLVRLYGKAYVSIDKERIIIKPDIFTKEKNIAWSDIQAIENKYNGFVIHRRDGSSLKLELAKLDYALLREVKEIVTALARETGVSVS